VEGVRDLNHLLSGWVRDSCWRAVSVARVCRVTRAIGVHCRTSYPCDTLALVLDIKQDQY
jgi:hypothetical protein